MGVSVTDQGYYYQTMHTVPLKKSATITGAFTSLAD